MYAALDMNPTLSEALQRLLEEKDRPIDTDPRVMEMVREQLQRDPPPSLAALYGRAVRINSEIRNLTPRQFNARYPLQVRKRLRRRKKAGDGRPGSGNGGGDGRRAGGSRLGAKADGFGAPRNGPRADGRVGIDVSARIRKVFLQYARVVAAAETTADLIEAVEEADRYAQAVADLLQGTRAVD